MKGNDLAAGQRFAEAAAERLLAAGAKKLLLACTELPIAFCDSRFAGLAIDPTEALARACIKASLGPVGAG